ncbi:unnamed protein product [Lathyrus sativus]|nr:unnamed protein product [Lathyrus sativus]
MSSKESCRSELRIAIRQLSDRCLYSATKWASEQLVGIEQDPSKFTPSYTRFQRGSSSIRRKFRTHEVTATPPAGVSYVVTPVMEEDALVDTDFYLLAKSYFDCREYKRAAHVLRDQIGRKSLFLRCYALYLAGEKRKEEEMIELEGPLGKSNAGNQELVSLEKELSTLRKNGTIDPFCLYLYGIILKQKGNENLARTVLVESVYSYPWNWNAWTELQSLCNSVDTLNSLTLSSHWMKEFFLAGVYQELRMHSESMLKYEYLLGTFSFSNYIQAQIAKVQYSLKEFDQVEAIFEELQRNDPYRVEDMDMYSNVLYSKECFSALSYLAHRVFLTDKYRPESCCIIGNYYSLKGQHEKAVVYFKRALKLNKNYLSAWTLMGHEFVEMKNTPAAVDAYRRAVDGFVNQHRIPNNSGTMSDEQSLGKEEPELIKNLRAAMISLQNLLTSNPNLASIFSNKNKLLPLFECFSVAEASDSNILQLCLAVLSLLTAHAPCLQAMVADGSSLLLLLQMLHSAPSCREGSLHVLYALATTPELAWAAAKHGGVSLHS